MLLFPFICLQAYASHFVGADSVKVNVADDYVKEYETVLVLRDSLKFLDDLKQTVTAENIRLQESSQEYSRLLKKRQQLLAKVESSILSSGLEEIMKRQAELQSKISEAEYEKKRLMQEINLLDQEIGQLQGHKDGLDLIKDEKSQQLIDKYGSYLDLPFSSMSIDGLQEILRECSGYVLDPRIEALAKRTDVILKYKRIYDRGNVLCSSSFNKEEVQKALEDLSNISGVNAEQNAEVEKLKTQLGKFEEGGLLFAEFINRLNEIRDSTTRYSPSDFNDDLSYILEGIEEKIKQTIRIVPYLDREFTKYMEILKTDPMQRPAIEQEMLGL
jgi:chromosome segregation ATPase